MGASLPFPSEPSGRGACSLDDASAAALAEAAHLEQLRRSLSLSKNEIGPKGMMALGAFSHSARLEVLELAGEPSG